MVKIDDTDRRLIALLKHNARLPITSLAKTLELSRVTVQSRIQKLVASGVIQKFTIQTSALGEDNLIRGVTTIEILGLKSEAVQRHLRKMPEVLSLHATNGKWGLVAFTETQSLASFDDLLNQIGKIPGVVSSETSLLLRKVV